MKLLTIIIFFFLIQNSGFGQIEAITQTGDQVILYDDGTWAYLETEDVKEKEIPFNPKTFVKNEQASFELKSKKVGASFFINPKKWQFSKSIDNPDAEYEISFKDGDIYGLVISEKIEVPILTLRTLALENAKSVSPDIKIASEEYREVNGKKVLAMRMDGTIQGIKFSYLGYYFSDTSGSLQFLTMTAQNLMDEYLPACEELLNGLVINE